MDLLIRRYQEDGKLSYFFILGTCFVMSIALMVLSVVFLKAGTYWSILPISGAVFLSSITYALTSYSKPKKKLEGHYELDEFYNVINGTKKVNFFIDYISANIFGNAAFHFFTLGYLLNDFKIAYINSVILVIFFISTAAFSIWVRLYYFKNINNSLISDIETINFLKNFFHIKHAKYAYEDYINCLKSTDDNLIIQGKINNKLSKRNLLSTLEYLKVEARKIQTNKKLIDNPSLALKRLLDSKKLIEEKNEK